MKKIIALALCLVMSIGLLASCGGDETATKNPESYPYPELVGTTLKVYNWGDYIDESVLEIFEQETGITVVYDVFDTNESMYTKVKNSPSSYDVVIPSEYMIKRMIDEGLLAKIDVNSLENYKLIGDSYKSQAHDPNNEYCVPYMWGTVGILYNTTMVNEPVTSWNILWDEDYSQKIFMMDSVRDSIGITLKLLGYSLNSTDLDQLAEAEAKLREQTDLVLAYTGDDVKDKMISGEGALAVIYSGDATTCMDPEEGNADLAYVVPEEGSNIWFDAMCVLEGSQNKAAAMKFIDFMCRTDIAELNRAYINYSTPQTEVYEALPDEIKNDPAQYPPDEIVAKCEVFADLGATMSYYDEMWTKIING